MYQKIHFNDLKSIIRQIERKFATDTKNFYKKEINIRCPYCDDKKFHHGLNFNKNAHNCYKCGSHGKLIDFLKEYNIKFESEKSIIVNNEQLELIKLKPPKDIIVEEKIAQKAILYLNKRGIDIDFLRNNFNYWPITDRKNYYFGYIIFPINDYAFYARKFLKLNKDKQKHIIKKSDPNMKLVALFDKNNSNTLLVVESMFNMIKAAQFGYDSVCIFGKGKWSSLSNYISKNKIEKNICLCFDKDVKLTEIENFAKKIKKNCSIKNMFYIDPNKMPCKDIALIDKKDTLIKIVKEAENVENIFMKTIEFNGSHNV